VEQQRYWFTMIVATQTRETKGLWSDKIGSRTPLGENEDSHGGKVAKPNMLSRTGKRGWANRVSAGGKNTRGSKTKTHTRGERGHRGGTVYQGIIAKKERHKGKDSKEPHDGFTRGEKEKKPVEIEKRRSVQETDQNQHRTQQKPTSGETS